MINTSPEQETFRSMVNSFAEQSSPPAKLRALAETERGFDLNDWKQLCGPLGASSIHIPEQWGGAGYSLVELGIVAEELGRHLYNGPFFSTIVLSSIALLTLASDEAKETKLRHICEASRVFTVVFDNVDDVEAIGHSINAQRNLDQGYQLDGVASIVIDAHAADEFLVFAKTTEGLSLFAIDANAEGVEVASVDTIDLTRRLARVSFERANAELISAHEPLDCTPFWDQVNLIASYEMIGGAQALMDSTTEFLKQRYQFGRPIGSFQALKHRCADLKTQIELARAAIGAACQSLTQTHDHHYKVHMARSMAGETYMSMAIAAVQLRGGMGFTWENDTHLWFRRAKCSEVLLGSPEWHRERLLTRMMGPS